MANLKEAGTYADGTRKWRLDFNDQHGRRVRENIAAATKDDARKVLRARQVAVDGGTYQNPRDSNAPGPGRTFADLVDAFTEQSTARTRHYDSILRPALEFFGDRPAASITTKDVDDYAALCGDGVGDSTTRKRITALCTVLKKGVRWGWLPRNPAEGVKRPREPEGEVKFLLGETISIAKAGSFVLVPRGTVHAWCRAGQEPAKILGIISPPGFEQFFDEAVDLDVTDTEAFVAKANELAEKYNMEIVGPPLEP